MENTLLKIIADNPNLLKELRVLFEKQFEPQRDWGNITASMTDEVLGQFLRARITGLEAIRNVFTEIERHKSVPASPEKVNRAR